MPPQPTLPSRLWQPLSASAAAFSGLLSCSLFFSTAAFLFFPLEPMSSVAFGGGQINGSVFFRAATSAIAPRRPGQKRLQQRQLSGSFFSSGSSAAAFSAAASSAAFSAASSAAAFSAASSGSCSGFSSFSAAASSAAALQRRAQRQLFRSSERTATFRRLSSRLPLALLVTFQQLVLLPQMVQFFFFASSFSSISFAL